MTTILRLQSDNQKQYATMIEELLRLRTDLTTRVEQQHPTLRSIQQAIDDSLNRSSHGRSKPLKRSRGPDVRRNPAHPKECKDITQYILSVHDAPKEFTVKQEAVLDLLQAVQSVADQSSDILAADSLTKSLWFPEMHERHDDMRGAYEKTFRWIYNDTTSFAWWLTSQDGVFWITGKPGSGKSTLMKFLEDDSETNHMLQKWAAIDDRRLVVAHHYFWNLGTTMQKSLQGKMMPRVHE